MLVGMGAIISPGAVVEPRSFIAAGTQVRAGQVVKEGELWGGVPARKLKDLSEKQKTQLFYQADQYVLLSKKHKHCMELGGVEKGLRIERSEIDAEASAAAAIEALDEPAKLKQ